MLNFLGSSLEVWKVQVFWLFGVNQKSQKKKDFVFLLQINGGYLNKYLCYGIS